MTASASPSLASRLPAETVQLAYQICVQGRADLSLAPDEATGFSMTLLRLLAFEPGGSRPTSARGGPSADMPRAAPSSAPSATQATTAPAALEPAALPVAADAGAPAVALPDNLADWPAFVATLKLAPIVAQLAAQTELISVDGNVLTLALPAAHKHLADKRYSDRLKSALEQATGRRLLLAFSVGAATETSLAAKEKRARDEKQSAIEASFRSEPFVQDVLERFDATIRPDSIKPVS